MYCAEICSFRRRNFIFFALRKKRSTLVASLSRKILLEFSQNFEGKLGRGLIQKCEMTREEAEEAEERARNRSPSHTFPNFGRILLYVETPRGEGKGGGGDG